MTGPALAQFNPNGTLATTERAYVVRQFERDAFQKLSANRWVTLLGPRKYGKTSALIRVRSQLRDNGFFSAFVDLQSYGRVEEDGYGQFLEWFAETICSEIGADFRRPFKRHRQQLDSWLQKIVTPDFPNTAILIDEASGAPLASRELFFSQLRAVHSRRSMDSPAGKVASRLVFAFAGTFRPNRLIDNANSPFNVSEEVNPDDLTCDEIAELAKLGLGDAAGDYAERAWSETRGQPYYVQSLFAAVQNAGSDPTARARAFDSAVDELRRGAHGHLDDLTRQVDDDEELRALVPQILEGKLAFQGGYPLHRYAIISGVARHEGGFLVPRNPIYASALARFADERYP